MNKENDFYNYLVANLTIEQAQIIVTGYGIIASLQKIPIVTTGTSQTFTTISTTLFGSDDEDERTMFRAARKILDDSADRIKLDYLSKFYRQEHNKLICEHETDEYVENRVRQYCRNRFPEPDYRFDHFDKVSNTMYVWDNPGAELLKFDVEWDHVPD